MPIADALASIRSIESRLDMLFGAQTPPVSSPSAEEFTTALQNAAVNLGGVGNAAAVSDPISAGAVTGADVARAAARYEGVPYVFGGTDENGIDCSGLVQRAFGDLGIDVPRLVRDQEHLGTEVPSLAQARPGDLVVSEGGDHIGIWMGDGKIIHAPYEGRTVSIVDNYLDDSDVVTIRRVIPDGSAAGSSDTAWGSGWASPARAAMLESARGGGLL